MSQIAQLMSTITPAPVFQLAAHSVGQSETNSTLSIHFIHFIFILYFSNLMFTNWIDTNKPILRIPTLTKIRF